MVYSLTMSFIPFRVVPPPCLLTFIDFCICRNKDNTKKSTEWSIRVPRCSNTVLLVQKCLSRSNPYPKVGFMLSTSPPVQISSHAHKRGSDFKIEFFPPSQPPCPDAAQIKQYFSYYYKEITNLQVKNPLFNWFD